MKSVFAVLMVGFSMLAGCGGDDSSGDSGTSGGSGNTTSSSNCDQQYGCVNGSCKCEAGPKKDQSCCDPDDSNCTDNKCDSFCKYCN